MEAHLEPLELQATMRGSKVGLGKTLRGMLLVWALLQDEEDRDTATPGMLSRTLSTEANVIHPAMKGASALFTQGTEPGVSGASRELQHAGRWAQSP